MESHQPEIFYFPLEYLCHDRYLSPASPLRNCRLVVTHFLPVFLPDMKRYYYFPQKPYLREIATFHVSWFRQDSSDWLRWGPWRELGLDLGLVPSRLRTGSISAHHTDDEQREGEREGGYDEEHLSVRLTVGLIDCRVKGDAGTLSLLRSHE